MRFGARAAFLIAAAGILSSSQQAKASPEKAIYAFCSQAHCADGSNPNSPLVEDGNGNLYGTTFSGGNASGTIFELSPSAHHRWEYKVIYTMCKTTLGCGEGVPNGGGLIFDKDGNLYGASSQAIFKLAPRPRGEWKLTILLDTHIILDGRSVTGKLSYLGASTGALYDGASPLYGASADAGIHGSGIVFTLTPINRNWQFNVLYNFCSKENCADGAIPLGGVLVAQPNEIFGITNWGGTPDCGCGVVYKLSPKDPPRKLWRETTLYSFCSVDNCIDGKLPVGSLAMDETGDLIGTTFQGGEGNSGTIFKVMPDDRHSVETVLHSFCSQPICGEGGAPESGVVFNSSGTMFGTNSTGGAFGYGTVYSLSGSALAPIYSFCSTNSPPCPDGEWPSLPVTLGADSNIFGVSRLGGNANDGGVVFEVKP